MSKDPKRKHYSTVDGKTQKRGKKTTSDTKFIPVITHNLRGSAGSSSPPPKTKTKLLLPEYQEELGRLRREIADIDREIAKDEEAGRETSVDLLIERENLKNEMVALRNKTDQEISSNILNDVELKESVSTVAIKNELLLEKQKKLRQEAEFEKDAEKRSKSQVTVNFIELQSRVKKETSNKKSKHFQKKGERGKTLAYDGREIATDASTHGKVGGSRDRMYGVEFGNADTSKMVWSYTVRMIKDLENEEARKIALTEILKEMEVPKAKEVANGIFNNANAKGDIKKFFTVNKDAEFSRLELKERDVSGKKTVVLQTGHRSSFTIPLSKK